MTAASQLLYDFLECSVRRCPDRTAVEEPGGRKISYRELGLLSDRLRDRLCYLGICRGDRAGIYLRKSIDAVVSIFGILKAGAAYVPVDPNGPASRNAYILSDCSVRVLILEKRFVEGWQREAGRASNQPNRIVLDEIGGGLALQRALDEMQQRDPARAAKPPGASQDDLAYILYTSGSTGKPKGVRLTHQNAASFVNWCCEAFEPNENDRFSSHSPFHFDLSILDIYVSLKQGATLVLIGEELGKDPRRLAPLICEERISVWYSTPSILSLLAQYGRLDQHDYSALRIILFAGEVFPVKHFRALKVLLPRPRYFNLYGPTETNVCTFYEVPAEVPPEQSKQFPIGRTCSHLRTIIVDEHGEPVPAGQEGELCVSGPGVTQGYWNLEEHTARAFLQGEACQRWYRTGDIVVEGSDGNYIFLGRRDRMVKRRGYRVELAEIEVALYRHKAIREAALIALADEEGVRIKAFLSCDEGKRPSIIELKRFCAENLPIYMVPDLFSFQQTLPKTSTNKIDYQRLKELD